jgi:hypothetical protein
MSADNAIVILWTKDTFKKINDSYYQNMFDNKIDAYRVAHAQAIDNFDWYIENEPHNIGFWLNSVFSDSPVFYDKNAALDFAAIMLKQYEYVEYGIVDLDASNYNFPGY